MASLGTATWVLDIDLCKFVWANQAAVQLWQSKSRADWLRAEGMDHVRGAPYHPQTQGKIERWHQTLKNRILLENYFLPGDLNASIERFVKHYNHHRYHESLQNRNKAA